MKITKEKIFDIIEKIGFYVICIPAVFFALFLFVVSMLHTTAVEIVNEGEGIHTIVNIVYERLESVIYYNDNFILNIIMLCIMLVFCFAVLSRFRGIKPIFKYLFIFAWTFALGTIWVISSQVSPTEDSLMVAYGGFDFARDDLSGIQNPEARYFRNYSFQLGYVFFNEILIRIYSKFKQPETLVFLEVINAFFLAVVNMFAVMITDRLFKDTRITNLSVFLLALSVAPVISCSFIYGIIPGMAFAVVAVYCEMRYLLDNKKILGIISAVCICIAMMIKSNYLIWLIAMTAVFVVMLPGRKKYILDVIMLVVMIVPAMCVQSAVKSYFEKRADTDLGDAIPYASWIAMGLNESELAPGWYNYFFTLTNFEDSQFNADVASERSMKVVKERISKFMDEPQYANDFFYKKIVSQWNETSYESIWNNVVRGQYKPKGKISEWVCNAGKVKVKKYMDYIAQLVFCGFVFGIAYIIKNKKFYQVPFPLIFLGGFMYQIISEGKSQYIIPYFILMTAFASVGIVWIADMFKAKYSHRVICSILFKPDEIMENNQIQENAEVLPEETEIQSKDVTEEENKAEVTEETEVKTDSENNEGD